jgi:hypothetical protein
LQRLVNNHNNIETIKYTVFVKFDKDDKIEIRENEITISLNSKPERAGQIENSYKG